MSVQDAASARAAPAIRWLRVLLAGFLAEVALVVVAIPLYLLPHAQTALNIGIPPASFIVLVAFGYWAARGAARSQVLNGFLAGLAGVLLYLCLVVIGSAAAHRDPMASMTPAYLLAHALKLVGGAVGGWLAARRAPLPNAPSVTS
jgi:putative membrane protein (TIGR04086 family)